MFFIYGTSSSSSSFFSPLILSSNLVPHTMCVVQPLSKDQLETFFEDGYIFIEEFYKEEILKDVSS